MSRSKLDIIEQRMQSKRQKTPLETDSIDYDQKKKSQFESVINNKLDYSHLDQQYAAYTQPDQNSLFKRLQSLEDKMVNVDSFMKQQSRTERKLEELALQFDRFISDRPSKNQHDPQVETRIKAIDERYDLINSKLDKGLLILQQDIQELNSSIQTQLEKILDPQIQDIEEQLKSTILDIEETKIQCQQMIKQVQGDLLFKIQELRGGGRIFDNDPLENQRKSQMQSQKKEENTSGRQIFSSGQKRERSNEEQKPLQQSQITSGSQLKLNKNIYEQNDSMQQQQSIRPKHEIISNLANYDETRRKIDEEINRRIQEENEKRKTLLQKENDKSFKEEQFNNIFISKISKQIQTYINVN